MCSELQAELARLRRFMREPSRTHDDDDGDVAAVDPMREQTTITDEKKETG